MEAKGLSATRPEVSAQRQVQRAHCPPSPGRVMIPELVLLSPALECVVISSHIAPSGVVSRFAAPPGALA